MSLHEHLCVCTWKCVFPSVTHIRIHDWDAATIAQILTRPVCLGVLLQIMKHMGCDDHIIAAIELYLDVINLFMMFMLIFSGGRD